MIIATQGADMSTQLTAVSAKAIFDAGKRFVVRYLGTGDPAKALLAGEANLIRAAGLNLVLVWEGNPTYLGYFTYAQGVSDAQAASARARALGVPMGLAIYFAVDMAVTGAGLSDVAAYVRGLKAAMKGYNVGVYGSYTVLVYLHASEPVAYYWQTYGWSSGNRAAFAQLYQYQNGVSVGGVTVDLDNAYSDPGWWLTTKASASASPLPVRTIVDTGYVLLGTGLIAVAAYYWYKRTKKKA